jgi:hypothetical protein
MSAMPAPAIDIEQVREAVLNAVQGGDRKPLELLSELGQRYADSDIQRALSELIREGKIELTQHRVLKRAAAAA